MKLKYKLLKLNPGLLMPTYVFLWPFLYALVQIGALSYYIDTQLLLIDWRLLFYVLALGACILKLLSGNTIKKYQLAALTILGFFAFFYLISFLFNINIPGIDFHQFINGFVLFSILTAYAILYSDLINWVLVAKFYAFSLFISAIFGVYAWSRFSYMGIIIFYNSLSEELFRLTGNRGFWVNCVLILAFIFFEFKDKKINSTIINASLILSNILLLIASQRNAFFVLLYELIIFSRYYSWNQSLVLFLLFSIVAVIFSQELFTLLNVTILNKIRVEQSLDGGRLGIWQATVDALTSDLRHIIFGVSEGGLPAVSGNNWPIAGSGSPHNILLYFWSATGLGGLILFIGIIALFAYLIHKNKKLHQILFYWIFVFSMVFVGGFIFYEKYSKSDFLNLGVIIAFSLLLRQQVQRFPQANQVLINQNSPRLNE